jgi:ribonuclease-3
MSLNFNEFCKIISYNFNNTLLLQEALTHPSSCRDIKIKFNYQRLEFLGDKVLALVISEFLMQKYQDEDEGSLSKRQAALVSGETLAEIALKISLNNFLQLSLGEEKLGGRSNKRNLENALEALIGAIYLDSNYLKAKEFILNLWQDFLEKNITPPQDPISELQEIVQLKFKELPIYETSKSGGLDHDPIFTSTLKITGLDLEFSAKGKSKKEAQKEVAKIALENFKS